VVSYKERKNFVQLIGEGALCLRNSSETEFAGDRNEAVQLSQIDYKTVIYSKMLPLKAIAN
jgi:hypothetical protein